MSRVSVTKPNVLLLVALLIVSHQKCSARTLGRCEITRELVRQQTSRSLLSNWVCLVESESGGDTAVRTGPLRDGSYNLGIFQINSKWCREGYVGGECNIRCEALTDDSVADDIKCAVKVHNRQGFAGWPGWMRKCKGKPLPNVSDCYRP